MAIIHPSALALVPTNVARYNTVHLAAIGRFDMLPFDLGIPTLLFGVGETDLNHLLTKLAKYPNLELKVLLKNGEVELRLLSSSWSGEIEAIYIPILEPAGSFDQFRDIIARLRNPQDGCPWDTKQSISSLRKNLLEECYEVLEAIDTTRFQELEEELGDLLLIIVMIAQIGEEEGIFNSASMIRSIAEKMIRRHPHIFSDTIVESVEDVFANWEEIKKQERAQKEKRITSILESVPFSLPALSQAQQLQDRAARVGFDWPEINPVLDKIREEADEINRAQSPSELESEFGDLFFVLVNFARWKKIDAETALQRANRKFRTRFRYIEEQVTQEGKELTDKSLTELDEYWNEAKKSEGGL